jgi:hypothetical protein
MELLSVIDLFTKSENIYSTLLRSSKHFRERTYDALGMMGMSGKVGKLLLDFDEPVPKPGYFLVTMEYDLGVSYNRLKDPRYVGIIDGKAVGGLYFTRDFEGGLYLYNTNEHFYSDCFEHPYWIKKPSKVGDIAEEGVIDWNGESQ